MSEDHAAKLGKAAAAYRRTKDRTKEASDQLADAVRAAHAAGMTKAEILRAISHVWSRTWLDGTLKEKAS